MNSFTLRSIRQYCNVSLLQSHVKCQMFNVLIHPSNFHLSLHIQTHTHTKTFTNRNDERKMHTQKKNYNIEIMRFSEKHPTAQRRPKLRKHNQKLQCHRRLREHRRRRRPLPPPLQPARMHNVAVYELISTVIDIQKVINRRPI